MIFASNASFFVSFPAFAYKFFLKKEYIRNVDDLWPEVWYDLGLVKSKLLKKLLDYLAGLSYHKAIAVVPVSEGYVPTLVTKYNLPKEKIVVIEHGVDTSKFFKGNSQSNNKKIKTVMYSGAISQGYDFDIVIKSAKLLESEPIHFVIRGKGELENKLKGMIKEKNLKNVEVNTEFLSQEQLTTLLNTADIFLVPMSTVKGFDLGLPTKILEYQAIGKPIICVSNGEPRKYVERTKIGLATSSRRPEELAKLILMLIRDSQLAKRLGANGINNIKNNLTLDLVGKRLMKVIKNRSLQ